MENGRLVTLSRGNVKVHAYQSCENRRQIVVVSYEGVVKKELINKRAKKDLGENTGHSKSFNGDGRVSYGRKVENYTWKVIKSNEQSTA